MSRTWPETVGNRGGDIGSQGLQRTVALENKKKKRRKVVY
jgi:hypothetical protein